MKSKVLLAVLVILGISQAFGYDNTQETKKLSEILMKARAIPQGEKFVLEEDSQEEVKPYISLKSEPVQIFQIDRNHQNPPDKAGEVAPAEPQN